MKSIKLFKYKNTWEFGRFCGLKYAVGFRVVGVDRYQGNVLKEYSILFENGNKKPFKVVFFKNFFECNYSRLGRKGDKLLEWYNSAQIREYKYKDSWDGKESYIIEC